VALFAFGWIHAPIYPGDMVRRSVLDLGIKHRRKYYPNRDVEIEDEDYPRRDTRWILDASWDYVVMRNVITNVRYRYEARTSNDPDKPFGAHLLDFGLYVIF
jgi:hypothetical protein